jgi:hypothetical protein
LRIKAVIAWPAGTFAHAYAANRRTAIEGMIEADPVATCVRKLMTERSAWTGSAADLLRAADFASDEVWKRSASWPKTPRALAGRLRRAQAFLWTPGIEVTFFREGRAGTRMISVSTSAEPTVSTVAASATKDHDRGQNNLNRPMTSATTNIAPIWSVRARLDRPPSGVADDADGADAKVPGSYPIAITIYWRRSPCYVSSIGPAGRMRLPAG